MLRGELQVVSPTGGCAGVTATLPPATIVHLKIVTPAGPVHAVAETLSPTASRLQPFRFIAMDDDDRSRLGLLLAPGAVAS